MQSSIGQYSTHAGEPAQPVQHSVITASSLGFFLRGVSIPVDLGSHFSSSGTIPTALVSAGMAAIITQHSAFGTRHSAQSPNGISSRELGYITLTATVALLACMRSRWI